MIKTSEKPTKKEVWIEPYNYHCPRCHKEVHVRGHWHSEEEFDGGYNKLVRHIQKEYEDKGYSVTKAHQYAVETAGKVYQEKLRAARRK